MVASPWTTPELGNSGRSLIFFSLIKQKPPKKPRSGPPGLGLPGVDLALTRQYLAHHGLPADLCRKIVLLESVLLHEETQDGPWFRLRNGMMFRFVILDQLPDQIQKVSQLMVFIVANDIDETVHQRGQFLKLRLGADRRQRHRQRAAEVFFEE